MYNGSLRQGVQLKPDWLGAAGVRQEKTKPSPEPEVLSGTGDSGRKGRGNSWVRLLSVTRSLSPGDIQAGDAAKAW